MNIVAPSITGTPQDGTTVQISAGVWTADATGFEVAVLTTDGDTIIPRQAVSGATDLVLNGVVGETLFARVWATGPGGTGSADSANFGPIAPGGETFVLGVAFQATAGSISEAFPYQAVTGSLNDPANLYQAGRGWGFGGSAVSASSPATSGTIPSNDTRFRGRAWGTAIAPSAQFFRVDVPNGQYRVFGGMAVGSTANSIVTLHDGVPGSGGTQVYTSGAASIAATNVRDFSGAVYSAGADRNANVAAWRAASGANPIASGVGVLVTVTQGSLCVAGFGTTPGQINNFAIFRVS